MLDDRGSCGRMDDTLSFLLVSQRRRRQHRAAAAVKEAKVESELEEIQEMYSVYV